jgi:hypothetical protein
MRRVFVSLAMLALSGCYQFSLEHRAPTSTTFLTSSDGSIVARPPSRLVTYERTVPSYFNGIGGTARIDTSRFCDQPVRTEVRVNTRDVLASMLTLLTYTPHTLYVTCEVP